MSWSVPDSNRPVFFLQPYRVMNNTYEKQIVQNTQFTLLVCQ